MSLTYSQKRFIQDNYQKKSTEEIGNTLKVSVDDINRHIEKYYKNFNKKIALGKNKDEDSPEVVEIPFKKWIREHWLNLLVLFFTPKFLCDERSSPYL